LLLATALGVVFAEGGANRFSGTDASERSHPGDTSAVHRLDSSGTRGPDVETEQPRVFAQSLTAREQNGAVDEPLLAASGAAAFAEGGVDSDRQAVSSRAQQWEPLIARYSWPVAEALSVLHCESEGDAAAYRDGNYGLFQVNAIHAWRVGGDLAALFDPATNVRVAFDVWRDNAGWGPWACKP
jgi:hypothetical protein